MKESKRTCALLITTMLIISMIGFVPAVILPAKASGITVFLNNPAPGPYKNTPNFEVTGAPTTFNVQVNISASAHDINQWEFVLGWDPLLVKFNSTTEGDYLSSLAPTYFEYYPSLIGNEVRVCCNFKDNSEQSGAGLLATIKLNAIENGRTYLVLSGVQLYNSTVGPVDPLTIDGRFWTQKPYVQYTMNPSAPDANQSNTLTALSYDPQDFWDITKDGLTDIFDIVTIGLAFGAVPGDSNWNRYADLVADNLIDIFDLVTVGTKFGMESVVTFYWQFGDGTPPQTRTYPTTTITHTWTNYAYNPYTVTLTVTDNDVQQTSRAKSVPIRRDPACSVIWPTPNPAYMESPEGFTYNQTEREEVVYWDTDNSTKVSVGDLKTPSGAAPLAGEIGRDLLNADELVWYDADISGHWDVGEQVYWDYDLSENVTADDIRIPDGSFVDAADADMNRTLTYDEKLRFYDADGGGAWTPMALYITLALLNLGSLPQTFTVRMTITNTTDTVLNRTQTITALGAGKTAYWYDMDTGDMETGYYDGWHYSTANGVFPDSYTITLQVLEPVVGELLADKTNNIISIDITITS